MVMIWFAIDVNYPETLKGPYQIREKLLIVKKTLIIFFGILIFNPEICYFENQSLTLLR
jgi:hypothetical protein